MSAEYSLSPKKDLDLRWFWWWDASLGFISFIELTCCWNDKLWTLMALKEWNRCFGYRYHFWLFTSRSELNKTMWMSTGWKNETVRLNNDGISVRSIVDRNRQCQGANEHTLIMNGIPIRYRCSFFAVPPTLFNIFQKANLTRSGQY